MPHHRPSPALAHPDPREPIPARAPQHPHPRPLPHALARAPALKAKRLARPGRVARGAGASAVDQLLAARPLCPERFHLPRKEGTTGPHPPHRPASPPAPHPPPPKWYPLHILAARPMGQTALPSPHPAHPHHRHHCPAPLHRSPAMGRPLDSTHRHPAPPRALPRRPHPLLPAAPPRTSPAKGSQPVTSSRSSPTSAATGTLHRARTPCSYTVHTPSVYGVACVDCFGSVVLAISRFTIKLYPPV